MWIVKGEGKVKKFKVDLDIKFREGLKEKRKINSQFGFSTNNFI